MNKSEGIEVFFITGSDGSIKHKTMFISEDKAKKALMDYIYEDRCFHLSSQTFEFVGKYLSQVEVYTGFDYNYGHSTGGNIVDVIHRSSLYPSVELSKTSKLWQSFKRNALLKPKDHNFYENSICSKEDSCNGKNDFYFGDVMESKFNMKIKRYKVDREL